MAFGITVVKVHQRFATETVHGFGVDDFKTQLRALDGHGHVVGVGEEARIDFGRLVRIGTLQGHAATAF